MIPLNKVNDYFRSDVFNDDEGINSSEIIYRANFAPNEIKYNHFIDARQPGVGKTTNMLNSINSNTEGKDLIIASSHEFLEEIKKKIKKKFVVLKGFSRACQKYNDDTKEGEIIREMHKKEIPNKLICMYMKCQGACYYRNQFSQAIKEDVSVGMPIQFLHLYEFYLFNSIHIEERVQGSFKLEWNTKEIRKELFKLINDIDSQKLKKIQEYIKNKDFKNLQSEAAYLSDAIMESNTKKVTNYTKVHKEVAKPDSKFLNHICKLNVNNLLFYLELESRDKENKLENNLNSISLSYQQLLFYRQLDYNIDLKYNCASFPKNEFLHYLKVFEELYPQYTGVVQIKRSHHKNKNVKIIKMNNSGHYKSHLNPQLTTYKPIIKKLIRNEKYNKKKKVCVLTYMGLVKDGKFLGSDAFWFGASHGINKYRKYDVLIVLGTHLPDIDTYENYYLEHHSDEDIPNFEDFDKSDGKMIPKDERLKAFYKEKFEDDVYDSVHRLRPLWQNNRKNITVYWFGNNVPEKLKEEFDYEERDF